MFVTCPLCGIRIIKIHLFNHLKEVHEPGIHQLLIDDPLSTYEEIFGAHNFKSKNARELRFKGGISVNLYGEFFAKMFCKFPVIT